MAASRGAMSAPLAPRPAKRSTTLFSRVRWATMDEVVDAVWESKRGPYERCRELAMPIIEAHLRGEEGGR